MRSLLSDELEPVEHRDDVLPPLPTDGE